jgi:hypothetical protein
MPSRGAKNGKQRGSTLSKPDKRFPVERYKAACGGADVDHSFCVYSPLVEEERAMIATR